jgi:hypothetical protein
LSVREALGDESEDERTLVGCSPVAVGRSSTYWFAAGSLGGMTEPTAARAPAGMPSAAARIAMMKILTTTDTQLGSRT